MLLLLCVACGLGSADVDSAADSSVGNATETGVDSADVPDTGTDDSDTDDTGTDDSDDSATDDSATDDTGTDSGTSLDADADGDPDASDCDDADPAVHAGASDTPGDGSDADCDGADGPVYVGCAPIDVPDTWATIADAVDAGELRPCLGEGTFVLEPGPDNDYLTGLDGQGRDRTDVTITGLHQPLYSATGLTLHGAVEHQLGLHLTDVTLSRMTAELEDYGTGFSCVRCLVEDTTISVSASARLSVQLSDSHLGTGWELRVLGRGCASARDCTYGELEATLLVENCTFTDVPEAWSLEVTGWATGEATVRNSVFQDLTTGLATFDVPDDFAFYGHDNVGWDVAGGYDVATTRVPLTEADPAFEPGYDPPRPSTESPLVDAATVDATATDYWNRVRTTADIGAVER